MKFLIYGSTYDLDGDSFIPVNTAFRCSISWCNNIVAEKTVLPRLTRFINVPVFHSIGACAFQQMLSVLSAFSACLFSLKTCFYLMSCSYNKCIQAYYFVCSFKIIFGWCEFSFLKTKSTFSGLTQALVTSTYIFQLHS